LPFLRFKFSVTICQRKRFQRWISDNVVERRVGQFWVGSKWIWSNSDFIDLSVQLSSIIYPIGNLLISVRLNSKIILVLLLDIIFSILVKVYLGFVVVDLNFVLCNFAFTIKRLSKRHGRCRRKCSKKVPFVWIHLRRRKNLQNQMMYCRLF